MKNQFLQALPNTSAVNKANSVSLFQLVKKLQISLMSQATGRKSFIVNDADQSIIIDAEEDVLAYVIGNMLSNTLQSTSNCCIHVETVNADGNLQIRIRNNSAIVYNSYVQGFEHFAIAARKLGGSIGLEAERKAITVVLSIAGKAA